MAGTSLMLGAAEEVNLARHLMRLGEVVREVERDLLPSKMCEYIFELSGKFNQARAMNVWSPLQPSATCCPLPSLTPSHPTGPFPHPAPSHWTLTPPSSMRAVPCSTLTRPSYSAHG